MPIFKTEILGSNIEINYEENERKKLITIIENFKKRLNEFPINQRISRNTIIFLAALKAEDQLEEIKNLLEKSQEDKKKINDQKNIIEKLNNEILSLKDELYQLNLTNLSGRKNNSIVIQEVEELENILESIQKKIKNSIR